MNVISILTKAAAISEGWTRVALNIRTSIQDHRLENYCKRCPIAHEDGVYKGICIKSKSGCGCNTNAKTAQESECCPQNLWCNDWFKPDELERLRKEHNFTN